MSVQLERLEGEIERLKREEEFLREKAIFASEAIQDLIDFVKNTPEPLGNNEKPYCFQTRLQKQKICLTLLLCLKKCYPYLDKYLRKKICQPILQEPGFQFVQLSKKSFLGKMKDVLRKHEMWYSGKTESNAHTKEIDNEMRKDIRAMMKQVDVLIFGLRGSGRSSFLAQLKKLYADDEATNEQANAHGVQHIVFKRENVTFKFIDTSKIEGERRKWIHCFEDVAAMLYVVNMSSYDQQIIEDEHVNQIQEARMLFDEYVNSVWLQRTNFYLLMNKCDLFKEKIEKVDMKCCFPEYNGGSDYEAASKYMASKFKKLNRRVGRSIQEYFICSIDQENIEIASKSLLQMLIRSTFRYD